MGVEHDRVVEAEEGIDAPVVEEPETPHLGTFRAVVAGVEERNRWHAEHADLLVGVPEVRDLEELRLVLEAREAVGAEEAIRRVGVVAAVAGLHRVRGHVEEEVASRLLVGRERRVRRGGLFEQADRVRWIGHLEDEVGELLHVARQDRPAPTEQPAERDVERLEREVLVERLPRRPLAIAPPVHRTVIGEAAQALRRHRAFEGAERFGSVEYRWHVDPSRIVVGRVGGRGITQVPGEAVEVAEDVAGRA